MIDELKSLSVLHRKDTLTVLRWATPLKSWLLPCIILFVAHCLVSCGAGTTKSMVVEIEHAQDQSTDGTPAFSCYDFFQMTVAFRVPIDATWNVESESSFLTHESGTKMAFDWDQLREANDAQRLVYHLARDTGEPFPNGEYQFKITTRQKRKTEVYEGRFKLYGLVQAMNIVSRQRKLQYPEALGDVTWF